MTYESGPETAGPQRHHSPHDLKRFQERLLPYLDAAHNLARYLLRDAHEAEDVVHDSFLRAIRHFEDFRGVEGRAWLLSIVRNTCFTRLRRRRSREGNVEFDEQIHALEEAATGLDVDLERLEEHPLG